MLLAILNGKKKKKTKSNGKAICKFKTSYSTSGQLLKKPSLPYFNSYSTIQRVYDGKLHY